MKRLKLSVIASFQLPPAKESDHGRERYKDFTFDHSYWSFDEADYHYASQEKVCVFDFDLTQCFGEGNCMSYTFLCAGFVKSHNNTEGDVKKRCII